MMRQGVVDPAKVTKSALRNAVERRYNNFKY